MTTSSVTRKALWLGGAAFLALGTPANAQNIDTMSQWNGITSISSWGVPNTATYGQTFVPTSGQTHLSGFTFQLSQTGGTAPQYQAFVYAFDPTTQRITGSALFRSGIFTAPSGAPFQTVSIGTGSVVLSPGQQYVLFLTTSTITGQANGTYKWGTVTNTAIPTGQFVFQNNGTNFAQLSSANWSTIGSDLAMQAFLSAGTAGENIVQAQTGAFQLGNSYLSLLTDPFATNKVTTTGTMNYAGEKPVPAAVRSAFGAYMKAPPPQVVYVPHWDVWGAAFGGANNTGGIAAAGTSDIYTRVGGVAAGADYRFTADSLIGFSPPAATSTGRFRRRSAAPAAPAAAPATRSWPASTANTASDRATFRRLRPTPTTGWGRAAPRPWAWTSSRPTITRKAGVVASKAATGSGSTGT
jgi:hypothetical protein